MIESILANYVPKIKLQYSWYSFWAAKHYQLKSTKAKKSKIEFFAQQSRSNAHRTMDFFEQGGVVNPSPLKVSLLRPHSKKKNTLYFALPVICEKIPGLKFSS